jgi:muramoyltetrapeptide carboxypeptidase LdcA involved in peptidoglycan recycling
MWKDAILFLETSEDAPPPVDVQRGLRSYASMGILKELSGLLFGRPGGKISLDQFDEYDKAILQVIRDEEGLMDLPIITQMDFGHTDPMLILPYGIQVEIDCNAQRFIILENAVIG